MSTYRRLLAYVRPYWPRMLVLSLTIMLFASLSGVSLTLIPPFLRVILERDAPASSLPGETSEGLPLPRFIEETRVEVKASFEGWMYAGDADERLARFIWLLIALMIAKNIFGYVQTYFTEYLEQRVLFRIRRDVYAHILDLPLSYFDRERAGHLISKVTHDVSMLRGAVIGVAASVLRNVLMTMLALTILLTVSWRLTLLVLCVVPLNVVLINWVGKKLKRRSRRAQEGMADMTASLEETIAGVRVVKAFDTRAHEQERFGRHSYRHMMHYIRMQMYGALSAPTSELLGTVSFAVVLWYGGQRVISGGLPAENLVMFVAAMLFVVSPLKNLSRLSTVVQQANASAQRVFDLLDVAKEHAVEGNQMAAFASDVRFENVSFEYVAGETVLREVSFAAGKGEVVAIVGSSGAGKTTLVDLIPRFYLPTAGRITIDGVDTRAFSLSSLRGLMGIVTQETILFNDSIYQNITYGSPNATREAVERASRAANAHDFIVEFPDGYDTVVGDRGAQLSGGQRQRIAIARAILRDPAILIFDEATSALDSESERLVQEAMERLFAGRTTFVIAHRLSTIRHADKILVLERGRLTEHGTHAELMTKNGTYHRLYQLQFGHANA
ncbi:MAG: ABC transporter ATP-binding protein/permease [Candidatus Latescibacteria bacterium]|nr:ABC transporter ATP-binding protein/permease [Candidatus Latescibacterota bacterium]